MNVIYRKLEITDIADYRALRLECLKEFPDNFGTTFDEESRNAKLKFEKPIEQNDQDKFMFGAFYEKQLIGIVGFQKEDRRKTKHRGEVTSMYVSAKFHGRRIGENLLRNLLDEAFQLEGLEFVELSVVSENQSAVKVYEKIGFKTFGIHPNYFKSEENYQHQTLMQLSKKDYENAR